MVGVADGQAWAMTSGSGPPAPTSRPLNAASRARGAPRLVQSTIEVLENRGDRDALLLAAGEP